jgi:hypothetical protein
MGEHLPLYFYAKKFLSKNAAKVKKIVCVYKFGMITLFSKASAIEREYV